MLTTGTTATTGTPAVNVCAAAGALLSRACRRREGWRVVVAHNLGCTRELKVLRSDGDDQQSIRRPARTRCIERCDDPRCRCGEGSGALRSDELAVPGTRSDVDGFEREPFSDKVEGNRVTFHFQGGWHEPHLVAGVTPADVRWISNLLARLSPRQWNDAFKAGGYGEAEAARYIKRLRAKIADGQNAG